MGLARKSHLSVDTETAIGGQSDTFSYDNLSRLTAGVDYLDNGNISSKTDVGDYLYDNAKKHAVTEVSELSRAHLNHDITYNHFGKTGTIQHLDRQYDGMDIAFVYGPTQERQQATLTTAWHTLHRYYAQNSEYTEIYADQLGVPQPEPTITLRKEYIYSPYGLIGIRNAYLTDVVYFNHEGVTPVATDHLGSIVAAYSPGRRTWEFSGYDAWGRRYRYDNTHACKEYPDEEKITGMDLHGVLDAFSRGYTGHEHLDMFGLINMNGRMYDPTLGRMLSPDTYVPDGTFTQDFNRYSYARNNPLSYVDPDGEFIIALAAIVGAYFGGASVNGNYNPFKWDWKDWKTYAGIGVGGVTGWLGASAATSVATSVLAGGGTAMQAAATSGLVAGMVSGGINGAGMTAIAGGNLGDIFGGMIQGGVIGGFTGLVGGAVFQGTSNFIDNLGIFKKILLLPNTVSYMASSTASQITANILTGQKPFENLDYGLNPGIIIPFLADVAPYIKSLTTNLAKKYNTKSDHEITSTNLQRTELMDNGDLNMRGFASGKQTIPGQYRDPSPWEILSRKSTAQIYVPEYQVSKIWGINSPFIRNYRTFINILTLTRIFNR